MSSNHFYVKAMLDYLSIKLSELSEPLSNQDIAMALYGMQNMSSDCDRYFSRLNFFRFLFLVSVRHFIEQLTVQIRSKRKTPESLSCDNKVGFMDGLNLGNALYGMKNFRSDNAETCNLLHILSEFIPAPSSNISNAFMIKTSDISRAFEGLRYLNSDSPNVLHK